MPSSAHVQRSRRASEGAPGLSRLVDGVSGLRRHPSAGRIQSRQNSVTRRIDPHGVRGADNGSPHYEGRADPRYWLEPERSTVWPCRRLVITAVVIEDRSQAEVARAYGVSAGWVSQLITRYRDEGEAASEPRSKRPKTSPTAINAATVELITRLRKQLSDHGLDAGPDTIAWHLQQSSSRGRPRGRGGRRAGPCRGPRGWCGRGRSRSRGRPG
jgi:transposase